MAVRVQIVFYSMYCHYWMAEAVASGAREVPGAEVILSQVSELVPDAVLEKSGSEKSARSFRSCSDCESRPAQRGGRAYLRHPDAIRQHGRSDAELPRPGRWVVGRKALVGKVGSAFASTGTQHGGQETPLPASTARCCISG